MKVWSAVEHLNPQYYLENLGSELHSDVALPATFVLERFRSVRPTGSCNCAISPAEKDERNT